MDGKVGEPVLLGMGVHRGRHTGSGGAQGGGGDSWPVALLGTRSVTVSEHPEGEKEEEEPLKQELRSVSILLIVVFN